MKQEIMKQEISLVRMMRSVLLLSLIFLACLASAAAQTVTPRVCVDTTYQTGTVTLAQPAAAGDRIITVNGYVPPLVSLVINPGGATEERLSYVNIRIDGNNPYTLGFTTGLHTALNPGNFNHPNLPGLAYAHSASETVRFEGYSGKAYFGYTNLSASTVSIPRGITSLNFFTPGPASYRGQPNTFLPGIRDNVFFTATVNNQGHEVIVSDSPSGDNLWTVPFGGQATDTLTWVLGSNNYSNAATARNGQGQGCATITYQGRLTDAGSAANGQYDLRLTVFDAVTGGTAQSSAVVIENAQVTNGIFTVHPNFGLNFTHNDKARFLEIAVRPGNAANTDPFTILAPRQPITSVPYAINAQTATNVAGGSVQLPLTTGPSSNDCHDATRGQTRVDVTNNKLYVCTLTGWKSTPLQ